jgi:hypothetical protein
MSPEKVRQTEPRMLRIFISYASEDLKIAHSIARGLSDALPEGFAEVCLDKWFLQAGEKFKKEIESKLERTDILIIVYTGLSKPSHSYTGWEVGFFEGVKRSDPSRRIVPLFLDDVPSTAAEFQGCSLNISPHLLQLNVAEFSAQNDVDEEDPLCQFIADLQEEAAKIKEDAGYSRTARRDRRDAITTVKDMRLAVFTYLRTTVETVLKPQKQITIKTTGAALLASDSDLPRDARLIPVGGSAMSIFGLGDDEMTWERFLQLTAGPHQDAWREAIASVIISSQAERINVDNSQVVISSDESRTYRIVLTTATKYWDDTREFNLYFVESLNRDDYGDRDTTAMLKGLELACRYRFLFLEGSSQFSANNILAVSDARFPDLSARLLREMNLMRKEASNAGIDQPFVWSHFIDWSLIREMSEAYRSRDGAVRELIGRVLSSKDRKEAMPAFRQDLSKAIGELEDATRVLNAKMIAGLLENLLERVRPDAAH